jgi:hypothetical protein
MRYRRYRATHLPLGQAAVESVTSAAFLYIGDQLYCGSTLPRSASCEHCS